MDYRSTPGAECVVLYASVSADTMASSKTDSLLQLFFVRKVAVELFDGAVTENRPTRNTMFDLGMAARSDGKRVVYPQVFFRAPDAPEGFTYVGTFDDVQIWNEEEDRDGTFTQRFGRLMGSLGGGADNDNGAAPTKDVEDVTPVEVAVAAAAAAASDTGASATNDRAEAKAVEEEEEAPLPAGWVKCVSSDDRVYYANKATKETSWVRPVEGHSSPWREMTSSDGRTYYYNTATGATQWVKPDDL